MPSRFNPIKIFAGRGSQHLAEKIASDFGKALGDSSIDQFSDGEIQPFFNETVRGCDVFIIQSTFSPSENLMELLLMIDAAKRASAHYISAVVPYFGYARQDRKDKPRVAIASKLNANLISAAGASRVMTMDLHAPQIQGFFDIPVDHLDGSVIFIPYIRSLNLENLVVASPDIGGSKRTRGYANHIDSEMVICDKHRKKANQIATMNIIGDVQDKNVVLIDDIIDTGGTLVEAARVMKSEGARSVRACITHPLLSGNAIEKIENSELEELVVCDTIPVSQDTTKIKTLSVSKLFAQAIRNVYEHGTISSLFQQSDAYQQDFNF
jgi:ribose-phosphate pyrophosphokinase